MPGTDDMEDTDADDEHEFELKYRADGVPIVPPSGPDLVERLGDGDE